MRTATVHVFVAIPGLPWVIADNHLLPSMRIQYGYLMMSYGYSRVGQWMAKNVELNFVFDLRSTKI